LSRYRQKGRSVQEYIVARHFRLSDTTGNEQTNHISDILSLKNAMQILGRYNDTGQRHGFIDKQ